MVPQLCLHAVGQHVALTLQLLNGALKKKTTEAVGTQLCFSPAHCGCTGMGWAGKPWFIHFTKLNERGLIL